MTRSRIGFLGLLLAGLVTTECTAQVADPRPPSVDFSTDRHDYNQYDPILLTTKVTNRDEAELLLRVGPVEIERQKETAWEGVDRAARNLATGEVRPKLHSGGRARLFFLQRQETRYYSIALFPSSVASEPGVYRARAICRYQFSDSSQPDIEATSSYRSFSVAAHAGNVAEFAQTTEFEWLDPLLESGLPPPVDRLGPESIAWLQSASTNPALSEPLRNYFFVTLADAKQAEGDYTTARTLSLKVSSAGYSGLLGGPASYAEYQRIRAGWYLATTQSACDQHSQEYARLVGACPALEAVPTVRDRGPSHRVGLPR